MKHPLTLCGSIELGQVNNRAVHLLQPLRPGNRRNNLNRPSALARVSNAVVVKLSTAGLQHGLDKLTITVQVGLHERHFFHKVRAGVLGVLLPPLEVLVLAPLVQLGAGNASRSTSSDLGASPGASHK